MSIYISNFKHKTFKIINLLFYARKTVGVERKQSECGKKTVGAGRKQSGCRKKTEYVQEGNGVGEGRKQSG